VALVLLHQLAAAVVEVNVVLKLVKMVVLAAAAEL
jgi:hypothetical protein